MHHGLTFFRPVHAYKLTLHQSFYPVQQTMTSIRSKSSPFRRLPLSPNALHYTFMYNVYLYALCRAYEKKFKKNLFKRHTHVRTEKGNENFILTIIIVLC